MFAYPVFYTKCSFKNGENVFNDGLANNGTATDCLTLGVDEHDYSASTISFAPNPFQTELIIASDVSLENSTLKMYKVLGQIVKEINHLNGNKITIIRDNLNSGIYLIRLFENGKVVASKKVLVAD